MSHTADILIVTVTDVESLAVLDAFKQATGTAATHCSIDSRIYFNLGIVNGARVYLTRSEMGAGGLDSSQMAIQKGIEALKPAAVIMAGIAFGVNEKEQRIGDILVTEQLRLYELQRVGTTKKSKLQIVLRGEKPHASPWLINQCKSANLLWNSATVRFGVVLTGEKLVDNIDFRSQLIGFEQEAIGGEMEGGGLYVACQDKKVDWILIKAICDWADGHKDEERANRQKIAAENAAAFVLYALQFVAVDWEKKRSESAKTTAIITNTGSGAIAKSGGVAVAIGNNVHGNVIINPKT